MCQHKLSIANAVKKAIEGKLPMARMDSNNANTSNTQRIQTQVPGRARHELTLY
jgi:hypothetical protein